MIFFPNHFISISIHSTFLFPHLHPAISPVHVLFADFHLAAALHHDALNASEELVVVTRAEKVSQWGSLQTHVTVRCGRWSYLQTRTSSGCRVLGVMIQGATLNTTVSVKMGVSGIPCGNTRQAAGLQANALLSLPVTWHGAAADGKWSWCLCCATPTQFSHRFCPLAPPLKVHLNFYVWKYCDSQVVKEGLNVRIVLYILTCTQYFWINSL